MGRFPTGIAAAVVALFVRDASTRPVIATTPVPVVTAPVPIDAPHPAVVADAPAPTNTGIYVGSSKCGDCHDKELQGWKASWHSRALSPAKRDYVVGNFANAHFTGASSEAWMTKAKDGAYEMRTHGPDGGFADFKVDWVIGGKRMQDNVTVFPDGRWQVLPVYFHVTDHSWVDYTETKQGALTPEHPFYWTNARRMANHECLDCHTTGLTVTYSDDKRHWDTSFADGSVACEDCHGPGGRHADTSEPRDIIHPVKAKQLGMTACARCHGPRNPLFPLLDSSHRFELGDSYDEFYDPIVVVLPQQGVSSDFFADGRPRTSSFEYQALIQSQCFRKGGVTCLDCHTAPHAGKRHFELRDDDPDASCKRCHADITPAHGHHKKVTCVQCHMPPVVSGVLDRFADHAIDIPVPQNTERHDIPNACGVCHSDRKVTELVAAVAQWWPDAGTRQARRLQLADAIDDTTAHDSARALIAVVSDAAEAPTLRGAAAILLARRFGPKTAPALLPLLASDQLLLRAKACEALGAARATTEANRLAAKLDDSSVRVQQACALALFDMGDPRGVAALERLAGAPATSHLMVPHLELAIMRAKQHDLAGARAELTKVVELMPYYTEALIRLAAISAELGDFAEAHKRVDQALALEPNHRGAKALRDKLPPL
ncbi:MAG TPA: ammonia-forming cytochrome c nitrite reductase subunit c552 [Kofleriaceae bacterium]|nr:ammonia-forming cytochrome c nitrite reductase subunit c552 [Kofleriaceae bacterium]